MITDKLRKFFERELVPFPGTKKAERTRDVVSAMIEVCRVTKEWQDFVETNGGDYLPGHAQRIHAALANLKAKLEEGMK